MRMPVSGPSTTATSGQRTEPREKSLPSVASEAGEMVRWGIHGAMETVRVTSIEDKDSYRADRVREGMGKVQSSGSSGI